MGFLITLILACVLIAIIVAVVTFSSESGVANLDSRECAATATKVSVSTLFFCLVCVAVFFGIIKGISYNAYLSMCQYKVTMEQNATEVRAYAEFGIGAFLPGQAVSKEITDLKFGDYQEELSDKIHSLRIKVASYNEYVIGKKIMKASPYWNLWIYMPDMTIETVTMEELLNR